MRLLLAALVLSGCMGGNIPITTSPANVTQAERDLVQSGIAAAMRDPGSAQFSGLRGYTASNGDRIICGAVNAKNGFGAYAGFNPFYVRIRDGVTMDVETRDFAATACNLAASGRMNISS